MRRDNTRKLLHAPFGIVAAVLARTVPERPSCQIDSRIGRIIQLDEAVGSIGLLVLAAVYLIDDNVRNRNVINASAIVDIRHSLNIVVRAVNSGDRNRAGK